MAANNATLCFPDSKKTCFACCPPIRPAHYEHIQHRTSVQRILRENTSDFDTRRREAHPITGYSCWALGYLDEDGRLVGCLLHPAQNRGEDLRDRVDYGNKCRRETCPEAKVFSMLKPEEKIFWLHMADGLNAFSYSSRKHNPLFTMMKWGDLVLGVIAAKESGPRMTWPDFLDRYPFFSTGVSPKGNAYLLNRLIKGKTVLLLRNKAFRQEFEAFSETIRERVKMEFTPSGDGHPVHRLDLDRHFLDFLRLSANIQRIHRQQALRIKEMVDQELEYLWKRKSEN